MKEIILEKQAEYYDSYLKVNNNPRYRKIWNFLEGNKKSGKLLDIGCCDGEFSSPLIKKGFECYGLEFMKEAIIDSKKKGIRVREGSFLNPFPFEDNFFDIVFAGEVIEHTIDDSFFLSEVKRVLKPGGILILTTPNLV